MKGGVAGGIEEENKDTIQQITAVTVTNTRWRARESCKDAVR